MNRTSCAASATPHPPLHLAHFNTRCSASASTFYAACFCCAAVASSVDPFDRAQGAFSSPTEAGWRQYVDATATLLLPAVGGGVTKQSTLRGSGSLERPSQGTLASPSSAGSANSSHPYHRRSSFDDYPEPFRARSSNMSGSAAALGGGYSRGSSMELLASLQRGSFDAAGSPRASTAADKGAQGAAEPSHLPALVSPLTASGRRTTSPHRLRSVRPVRPSADELLLLSATSGSPLRPQAHAAATAPSVLSSTATLSQRPPSPTRYSSTQVRCSCLPCDLLLASFIDSTYCPHAHIGRR